MFIWVLNTHLGQKLKNRGNEPSKMKKAGSKKRKILKKMNLQTVLDTKNKKESFSEKTKKQKKQKQDTDHFHLLENMQRLEML